MSPPPVTFSEMRSVLLAEADRIGGIQEALVAAGLRSAPEEGELRRKHVFERLAQLIDRVTADSVIKDRLKGATR